MAAMSPLKDEAGTQQWVAWMNRNGTGNRLQFVCDYLIANVKWQSLAQFGNGESRLNGV